MKNKYFVDPLTGTYSNLMNEIDRPDVAEALDKNKVKFNSVKGQFERGDKIGPLSDFKDDLKKE